MFTLLGTDPSSKARRGILRTKRGDIATPQFMPVGTQGSVKAVSPDELTQLGAQIILGNTYHLFVRPGMDVMKKFGGLHRFMAWDKPILTDSGGFQVFSLAKLRKITPEGVHFQNHLDGSPMFLGPREAMEIQTTLGSDIAMVFDECPPHPCERDYAAKSLALTLRWARTCRETWSELQNQKSESQMEPGRRWAAQIRNQKSEIPSQLSTLNSQLFGIVQGSSYADLRRESAEALVQIGFDGYAIGGVSVGESEPEMMAAVEAAELFLPSEKPRYAMGLGTPPQLVEMVARGVDMFDCVLPTRIARNGTAFTERGTLNLKNAEFIMDEGPIEDGCECPACRKFARGYLRHLLKANEILGLRLVTLHNLHFYLNLMRRIRAHIEAGTFAEFRKKFVSEYVPWKPEEVPE